MGHEGEFVRLEVDADTGVGTIRLDRPKMNAMHLPMWEELGEAALAAEDDDAVGAVVVWGGERTFAAGADIGGFPGLTVQGAKDLSVKLQRATNQLAGMSKISIAAVTGYALGGGCEVAMACDFRVLADDARLGQPEILLGIIPGAGGSVRLPRLVGLARAKELVFSGRMVDAEEAVRIGLAEQAVPAAETYEAAVAMAARYAAGPLALRYAKRALEDGTEVPLDVALRLEADLFGACFASEDQDTGVASFQEHGPGKATFRRR